MEKTISKFKWSKNTLQCAHLNLIEAKTRLAQNLHIVAQIFWPTRAGEVGQAEEAAVVSSDIAIIEIALSESACPNYT